jgi:hypothetical protein
MSLERPEGLRNGGKLTLKGGDYKDTNHYNAERLTKCKRGMMSWREKFGRGMFLTLFFCLVPNNET